jgi:hypothetical protein
VSEPLNIVSVRAIPHTLNGDETPGKPFGYMLCIKAVTADGRELGCNVAWSVKDVKDRTPESASELFQQLIVNALEAIMYCLDTERKQS